MRLFLLLCLFAGSIAFRNPLRNYKPTVNPRGDDPGPTLFLTPLIEDGKIQEARNQSATSIIDIKGHSGFITVNKTFNSNMYFWYFPAKNGNKSAPLLMWLQGGPGATSMFALFVENGPYTITKDLRVLVKPITWANEYNIVYVDNPVGTGLSFTKDELGYAKDETDVGQNLYNFLVQFYQMFPELQTVPFYITGESYAGKYIPAIAYKIHTENAKGKSHIDVKMPLTGLIIGDGLCDPESMMSAYGDLMYNVGLLDENQRDHVNAAFYEAVELIRSKDFLGAYKIFDLILNGDLTPYPTYFFNATGSNNYDNYMTTVEPADYDWWFNYMDSVEVRKAVHIGNATWNSGSLVEQHLINDVADTVKPWIIELLNSGKYSLLFYNGQLDIIVGHPLTERFLWNLEWSGLKQYRQAERSVWKVNVNDTEIAGYVRTAGKLTQALIRGAGHIVPYDQPKRVLNLINRFIQNSR